jgi:hypothetical protein
MKRLDKDMDELIPGTGRTITIVAGYRRNSSMEVNKRIVDGIGHMELKGHHDPEG